MEMNKKLILLILVVILTAFIALISVAVNYIKQAPDNQWLTFILWPFILIARFFGNAFVMKLTVILSFFMELILLWYILKNYIEMKKMILLIIANFVLTSILIQVCNLIAGDERYYIVGSLALFIIPLTLYFVVVRIYKISIPYLIPKLLGVKIIGVIILVIGYYISNYVDMKLYNFNL